MAAICFGEVPSNLRSEDFRMRKLTGKKFPVSLAIEMHTSGSETSQYREEKKLISISLVAASESESAQTVEFLRPFKFFEWYEKFAGL